MRRPGVRAALSVGLGLYVTLASLSAEAGDILRGGSATGSKPPSLGGGLNPGAGGAAMGNARDALARTTQAMKAVQAMQNAARNAARRGPNNLGLDPNHAGIQLPNVPNGLTLGGLQVAPGVPIDLSKPVAGEDPKLWQGAALPKQTVANGQTTVTIKQDAAQALLTWQSFNVGKETTVNFNQKAGNETDGSNNWIAFNRILDPSGVPSQILGSINADGAVYLINQNGIIFGGSSQINLHSFVASSLPINDNLVARGLLNNPDAQFLFSALPLEAGSNGTPAFIPSAPLTPDGRVGDVVVQPGATISAPSTAAHVGGRVALIGANVSNAGTISTPDGQTVLAAGLQVGVAAHATSDPSLRGLDVYVGAIVKPTPPAPQPAQGEEPPSATDKPHAGTASNSGFIDAPRAAVTITGKNVDQLGAIRSSTSVSLNGRVDLLADYDAVSNLESNISNASSSGGLRNLSPFLFLPKSSGTVTIGADSSIQILPELDSIETVVGTQLALPSQINLQGRVVHFGNNAAVLAPNANVEISAGTWNYIAGSNQQTNFINAGGQIYLDPGALINVAGSAGIIAPMSQNILAVELRGTELADAPLQREGPFRGLTIQVDIRNAGIYNGFSWVGTPLANVSGYVGLIKRTVGELTTAGGTVKLKAGDSVVMREGSTIDVSGGSIDYAGGVVQTTRIVSDGRLLDISQATPEFVYDGIYTGTFTKSVVKYGISETFTNPLLLNGAHFEEGYTFGANGGTVAIMAPAMVLDGNLLGSTITGPRQRAVPPVASMLSLAFQAQDPTIARTFPLYSPTPPAIVFQPNTSLLSADPFAIDAAGNPLPLRADRIAQVVLSPDLLNENGFGILRIDNNDGTILVPADVNLTAPARGTIAMKAANIDLEGAVAAPGGVLSFDVFNVSQAKLNVLSITPTPVTPPADPARGQFTLAAGASLSVAGLVVDDRANAPHPGILPLTINGGTITINSYSANLAQGSWIDASGGVAVSATNKRTYGTGGSISISAGQDPLIKSVLGGHLELGATLSGYSGSKGGALSILAPLIQIGGTASRPDTLLLAPEFFSHGGFGSFKIGGLGAPGENADEFIPAIAIVPGTLISPVAQSYLAVPDPSNETGIALTPTVMPEGMRTPVSLTFNAPGVTDAFVNTILISRGDFVMGERATIRTDAMGSVTISANTADVLGSIVVPGGNISITGKNSTAILLHNPDQLKTNVHVGPNAFLSTAGTTVSTFDPRGFHTGFVLPGGTINLTGNIVAEMGATLDVSGTSHVLDFRPSYSEISGAVSDLFANPMHDGSFAGFTVVPTRVDTRGGSITLAGDQALFTDATLLGAAGGATVPGGSLTISSGRFAPPGAEPQTPLDVTLTLVQSGRVLPAQTAGKSLIGKAVLDANDKAIAGRGYFAVDQFEAGGFDSLALRGTVAFSGPVTIGAPRELSVADNGVIYADHAVNLSAPHVILGTAFSPPFSPLDPKSPFTLGSLPFNFDPAFGTGSLTVRAALIDIGNLSLQNIGAAHFIANNGDVRGDGTLDVAGKITIRAGQIYPPTAVSFTIAAYDHKIGETIVPGVVTIAGSGNRSLPLSAGGSLNVYGSVIEQGGVLRAPLGTINIGWDGTGDAPPSDLITGKAVAPTQKLTLKAGSLTSVSAIDPATGNALLIPYGINVNDSSWVDPAGTDITAGGVPGKAITLSGVNLFNHGGSVINTQGGGDLFAYRFISGIGGTKDVLASSSGFAVIPGYGFDYAPFASFNTGPNAANLRADPGYVNSGLSVGDRVYLGASDGLSAGFYTLLPARYVLSLGAFLVTPQSAAPVGGFAMPDGSSIVSGYRFNDMNAARSGQPLNIRFEVASADVVRSRAEYADYSANNFLRESATSLGLTVPRLPVDAGHLILTATQAMTLKGAVFADAPTSGRGGLVDISSSADVLVARASVEAAPGTLVLDASDLSRSGAESLLIGGIRQIGSKSTTVTVKTGNLTVDNAGNALVAPEIILVANKRLTLEAGAQIEQSSTLARGGDTLLLGDSTVPGSGDGVLLRVTGDSSAQIVRSGRGSSTEPSMVIGAGARISGGSITLDSTHATSLDPTAVLDGEAIALNSGQISIQLTDPGTLQPGAGLVLAGPALQSLQTAQSLALLSYSSIDIYGNGRFETTGNLALHAAEIRGFNNNNSASVTFSAANIALDNSANGTAPGSILTPNGTLEFNADTIRLGANALKVDQFANLDLNATGGLLVTGSGSLSTQGALTATVPLITATRAANQAIKAAGELTIATTGSEAASLVHGGLGAKLSLEGLSIAAGSDIELPSGALTLHATDGDLVVGGAMNVAGTSQNFHDLMRYTSGGQINLASDAGAVIIGPSGTLNAAAEAGGPNAGSVTVSAPAGDFALAGQMMGSGGAGGTFSLDVARVPGGSLGSLNATLNEGGFMQSRSIRLRAGDVLVDGLAKTRTFNLSADQGSITVTGTIDASGATGGAINLQAFGTVALERGALLTVAGEDFNNAGKGGAVSLEAASQTNGKFDSSALVDIQAGAKIDLSVASNTSTSPTFGNFTGTLHLRAPQNATSTDVAINAINGSVVDASSIVVEGYKLYTPAGGNMSSAVQTNVRNNGTIFAENTDAITTRLLPNNIGLDPAVSIVPGAELINTAGDLTLGAANSTPAGDWDLSTFRFGPKNVPGILTLRAAGDLLFFNALSDGFTSSAYDATLLAQNTLLPLNAQSWSYRLTAGADFAAADFHRTQPVAALGESGSLQLGKNFGVNVFPPSGAKAQTRTAVANRFQVIRTGSGDIDISVGRDVQLLNQFATIYTAGTQVADPTMGGTFDVPILDASGGQSALGDVQQNPSYPAQYALAGGNVTIAAQRDILHQTQDNAGNLIADSSKELPNNWLYRRGYVNPATGEFGKARFGDVASTSWWVDYSNFFEGVGALGGGNVAMLAGRDVRNVDGVVPTNARMPKGTPNAAGLVELGGGDLIIRAGHDIDAGAYYVEHGDGTLRAGNSIHTNSTRSPSRGAIVNPAEVFAPETWLPTTLFLGKGTFDVAGGGDVTLGPVANPFLLPGGYNNTFWYKTYFSTYASDDAVTVNSLGGAVTLRTAATLPTAGPGAAIPMLQAWLENVSLFNIGSQQSVSSYQPWLRLNETSVAPFSKVVALVPPTLRATAFSGDINLVGDLTLFPSSHGTINLVAAGGINGLQPNGISAIDGALVTTWGTSQLNLSDADPNRIPGTASPLAYQLVAGTATGLARQTGSEFLLPIDALFNETGSTVGAAGAFQNKQALHGSRVLHADDSDPIHLYAETGNISGLTAFSGKAARVIAGGDITDLALYIQNVAVNDISVVSAGRDVIANNANSLLRAAANAPGNVLNLDAETLNGDIQISGPGALEVLAGRNLDLGAGGNNADGTGVGITSIGNGRNPNLPFQGASIVAGAGIGPAIDLARSNLDFDSFIKKIAPADLDRYLAEIQSEHTASGIGNGGTDLSSEFDKLPAEQHDLLAMDIFYRVLRDAGRNAGSSGPSGPSASADSARYDAGFAAIDALFGGAERIGDISTHARDIRTRSGGSISIFAPGGTLTLAPVVSDDATLAPPGVITEAGGNVSIFTNGNVDLGVSRIFTLRGGNIIIWSSAGDIAAGSSSKTVQSAPPTRVLIDSQTADVKTDLAGLATGGGIGVLATVEGVPPGNVDLIAPGGLIDAGDAGIRVSGNLNIAATQVLNASNISATGGSSGVPSSPTVAAPNLGSLSAASSTAGAATSAANEVAKQGQTQPQQQELPSIITVEVLGFGGGEAGTDQEEEEKRRKKKEAEAASAAQFPTTEHRKS